MAKRLEEAYLSLARELVKGEIRKQGHKVSDYYAKDITKAAKVLLRNPTWGPWIRKRVKLARRKIVRVLSLARTA